MPSVPDTLPEAGMRKALDISTFMSVIWSHTALELFISRWSVETHTFIAAWREFAPTVENVVVKFLLLLFRNHGANGIVMSEEEEMTLQLLHATFRVSNKWMYISQVRYFRDGEGHWKGLIAKALLSYWLSQFILPSGLEDGINPYVFPLAISLRGKEALP